MRRVLLGGLLFGGLALGAPQDLAGPIAPRTLDWHQEVFFAVLEGLYADGVQNEAVDVLLAHENGRALHFVTGCPICSPAVDALRVYRGRPAFANKVRSDTFGPGLTVAELARLRSPEQDERLAAIGALVERWVARRIEARRPTDEERAAWSATLRALREKGMALLAAEQRSARSEGLDVPALELERCAFCDGANEACRR